MYDALMLAAIVDELNDTVLDGKVQRVLLLDPLTIGFEVYSGKRHQLLVSADAREPRLHLVGAGDESGRLTGDATRVTPLLLLLRKYARGARLVRVYQPSRLERVVFLRFAKFVPTGAAEPPTDAAEDGDDETLLDGDLVETTLAVEIMGRHSNLVLIDDEGLIMDSAKRVPSRLSRVRPILPKLNYVPVPPQEKADPQAIGKGDLAAILAAEPSAALPSLLVGKLRGISPQVAREVAFRASGSPKPRAEAVIGQEAALRHALDEVLAPLRTGAWSPRLYGEAVDDGASVDGASVEGGSLTVDGESSPLSTVNGPPSTVTSPQAFSPFPLFHLRGLAEERFASPSALVERFFGATARVQEHGQRKEAIGAAIRHERERVAAREHALLVEAERATEAETWKRWGEAIYAYGWSLKPGQRELVADELTVPLDPARSPSENAQEFFERYRKAQSAAANVPALLEEARTTIRYLDQLLTFLQLAEGYAAIEAIEREWQEWRGRDRADGIPGNAAKGGKPKRAKQGGSKTARPQSIRARGGHQIFIGHSGVQNDAVTFDIAGPDDVWLHSRGVPGSHVIVKWSGGREDEAILQAAAELAAYYSANREAGRVEVDHAARRDVRKIKGTGPGMVTYRNERTVRVTPRSEQDLRKVGLLE
jgi:predicted ribosome quality control (RQC) complex YloA/Tae2 family protein